MTLTQLKKEQMKINNGFIEQIRGDTIVLRTLADNMAECATNIRGQGYTTFLSSRDTFLKSLDNMLKDYVSYLSVDSNFER